jgi:prepilin-type N-terminal cleavage/methylation domain-containing protein
MLKQLKRESGFTIIELLIVIAIIGILATLVLTNFQGAQAKGRDTVRESDMNSIYQKLEEFYNENGGYPDGSLDGTVAVGINEAEALSTDGVFPGLDVGALADDDGEIIVSSFSTGDPVAIVIPDGTGASEYAYNAYNCDAGTPTTDVGATCEKYTLAVFQERDEDNGRSKVSLN